jgi:hypothetical protein
MAKPRLKQSRQPEELDEDGIPLEPHNRLTNNLGQDESLNDFLRNMHGTSTLGEDVRSEGPRSYCDPDSVGHQETSQAASASSPKLPSIGWLQSQFKTKSATIRYLHSQGFTVNEIRRHLGFRYQMVRNVLHNQLKRGPNEDFHLSEGQAVESFKRITPEDN